jgi:hypothetical protein
MLNSKCRVPGATLEHGGIGTESIIAGPLPKAFWFTSERKYVWYQCGTPASVAVGVILSIRVENLSAIDIRYSVRSALILSAMLGVL